MFLFLSLLLIMLLVIGVLGFRLSVKNDSESEMIISGLIILIRFISIWILGYLQRNGMDVCKDVCLVCDCKNTCFLAFLNLDLDFVMLYSEGESNGQVFV